MKKLLSYIFLFVYLFSQAAVALPVFNSVTDSYEFKKACKYGRKKAILEKTTSDEISFATSDEKSGKKIISFCGSEVHTIYELYFLIYSSPGINQEIIYLTSPYWCCKNIHSPPPCIV